MSPSQRPVIITLSIVAVACVVAVAVTITRPRPVVPAGKPKSDPIVLRITHTESNGQAKTILEEIGKELEDQYWQKGLTLQVRIEYVSWGSLATLLDAGLQSRSLPQLTHLQPFMTHELHMANMLEPMDDVIDELEAAHGPILPAVRELQNFDGRHYGLAYAVGTTFFAYRRDWAAEAGYAADFQPTDWASLTEFVRRLDKVARSHGKRGAVILPGRDPFFMEQFFTEVCASASTDLWARTTFRPRLNSPEVTRVLEALRELRPYLHEQWLSSNYLDQFDLMRDGEVGFAPVTYGRATLVLAQSRAVQPADDTVFGVISQPPLIAGGTGFATIDCENWSIIRSEDPRQTKAAKDFLHLYYKPSYYLRFCSCVPIHLTPVFQNLASSPEYLDGTEIANWRKKWGSWFAESSAVLTANRTRPILMANPEDKEAPFLLDVQKRGILAELVSKAIATPDIPIADLQKIAQERAELAWREAVNQ